MSTETFPNTQPPEEPLVTNDQEESKWDLYQIPPVDPRPPEEKLAAPLPYNGPVRSESSTIGKDKGTQYKLPSDIETRSKDEQRHFANEKARAQRVYSMHEPFEGFYDIPTGLTSAEVAARRAPERDTVQQPTEQTPSDEATQTDTAAEEQRLEAEVRARDAEIARLRQSIKDIHEGYQEMLHSGDAPHEERAHEPNPTVLQIEQLHTPQYEMKYINFLEDLRANMRQGEGSVMHALDGLNTNDSSLKLEIIADLEQADLIDSESGALIVDEVEIRLEQQMELVDALKYDKDVVGARYTFKSGMKIEITDRNGEGQDAKYSVLTTTTQNGKPVKLTYKLTSSQLIEQLGKQ